MTKEIKVSCHSGPVMLLAHRGLELYGASKTEAEHNYYEFDLVISLDSIQPYYKGNIIAAKVESEPLKRFVEKHQKAPEHLRLYWPDMSIPEMDRAFWVELAYILRKKGRDRERHQGSYKVMVHCIGGHGRTGTLLCILANLCTDEGWHDENLLTKVRKLHCHKATETNSQIKYIERILGFKLDHPTPSKNISSYTNSGPSGFVTNYNYNSKPMPKSDKNFSGSKVKPYTAITQEDVDAKAAEREIKDKLRWRCYEHYIRGCTDCIASDKKFFETPVPCDKHGFTKCKHCDA
jgi:protein-tyrosine phosphatase